MIKKCVALAKVRNLMGTPIDYPESDIDIVRQSLDRLMKLCGFDASRIRNQKVLIHPNLVRPNPKVIPASSTDPRVIIACVRLMKDLQASVIQVGENPGFRFPGRKAFKEANLIDPLSKEGVEILFFDECEWVDVVNPNGKLFRNIKYSKPALDADLVINIPKWKTHMLTNASLSIKNLLGFIHDDQRMLFHRNDIIDKIVDLTFVRNPDLNIVDGIWAMEGQAPFHGEAVKDFNYLAMGQDLTALDCTCAKMMGFDVREVPHLALARKRLWNGVDHSIDILGDPLEVRPFKRPVLSSAGQFPLNVIECGVCNGCLSAVRHSLDKIDFEHGFAGIPPCTIISGRSMPNMETLETWEGELILFGHCALEFQFYDVARRHMATLIPGCPPHVLDLERLLKDRRNANANASNR